MLTKCLNLQKKNWLILRKQWKFRTFGKILKHSVKPFTIPIELKYAISFLLCSEIISKYFFLLKVLEDIRSLRQDESLASWWDCFVINKLQIAELTSTNEQLEKLKTDLKSNELYNLTHQIDNLQNESYTSLIRLKMEHKTPNW